MEPRGFVEEYLRGLYGDAGPTSVALPPMAQPTVIEDEGEPIIRPLSEALAARAAPGMDRAPLAPSAPPVAAQAAPVAQPLDYMRALDEAQRQDEMEAALRRVGGSVGQVAQIVSRGAYQPPPMVAPASRVSQLAQRQQAVEDFLRQAREGRAEERAEAKSERDAVLAQYEASKARALELSRTLRDAIDAQKAPEEIKRIKADTEAAAARTALYQKQAEALDRPRAKAGPKAEPTPKPRQLAATDVKELAEIDVAMGQLDDLSKRYEALNLGGLAGRAGAFATSTLGLTDTDAARYAARARIVQQGIGKILEGGKLAAGDELKYREMLPKPGDGPLVLKEKTDAMRDYLSDLKSKGISAFGAAGFQVPGAAPVAAQPVSAQAEAAIDALQRAVDARKPESELQRLREEANRLVEAAAKEG